jgi:DNA topoisomerase-1
MPKKRLRIIFHEITKSALMEALEHPHHINHNLVNAQQTRRILDRLVGYKLSPFLWKKVMRGLSAGRVQSVTVRLVVEREREIRAFKKQEYWTIDALFNKKTGKKEPFSASLHSYNTKKLDKFAIPAELEAEDMRKTLEKLPYAVQTITIKEVRKQPFPPFRTATLQQDAHSKFGFSSKQTMMLAQKLYEGVHLGHTIGSTGLITYMRTDSTRLSTDALTGAREYIQETYGASFLPPEPRLYKVSKKAQDAHEARTRFLNAVIIHIQSHHHITG